MPDTATGVLVYDVLPAGVTYDSDTSGGTYNASTGIWTIGRMPALDHQTLTITVLVTMGNSGGTVTNIASVDSGTWDPNRPNNTTTNLVVVPPRGVIVGTDIGCVTGPFVRVIDPDTGANRITPYFAYEPSFRGGCRVYGADVRTLLDTVGEIGSSHRRRLDASSGRAREDRRSASVPRHYSPPSSHARSSSNRTVHEPEPEDAEGVRRRGRRRFHNET